LETKVAPMNMTREGYVLSGWYLDKEQKQAVDFTTDINKNVTFYAKWEKVGTGSIVVNYLDQSGKKIHDAQILEGYVGDTYDVSTGDYKLAIKGYALDESKLPSNTTGVFSESAQVVDYVYTKQIAAPVSVEYVDQDGNKIHDSYVINGSLGDAYDVSTADYKLAIKGYALDESKLPNNATGVFSESEQVVRYTYSKNTNPAKPKPDNNPENRPSNTTNQTQSDYYKTTKNLPQTGEQKATISIMIGVVLIAIVTGIFFVLRKKNQNKHK